jgi:hypothetical protein
MGAVVPGVLRGAMRAVFLRVSVCGRFGVCSCRFCIMAGPSRGAGFLSLRFGSVLFFSFCYFGAILLFLCSSLSPLLYFAFAF